MTSDLVMINDIAGPRLVAKTKNLVDENERRIGYEQWLTAWHRLLDLIWKYVPDSYLAWQIHFVRIMHATDRQLYWAVWVLYDIEIRHRFADRMVDPALFHAALWDDAKMKVQQTQFQFDRFRSSFPSGPGNQFQSFLSSSRPSNPFRTNQGSAPPPTGPTSGQRPIRCTRCGNDSPDHYAKSCSARLMVNGRPTFLQADRDGNFTDRNNNRYCFAFNGASTCQQGASQCRKGKHACSLCGNLGHGAQTCYVVRAQ